MYDTPQGHVTRDYREGLGQLGDLRFRVIDTSGLEPSAAAHTLQVIGLWVFDEGGSHGEWTLDTDGGSAAVHGIVNSLLMLAAAMM